MTTTLFTYMKQKLNKIIRHFFSAALIMVLSVGISCQKEKLPNEVKTVEDAYRVIVGAWEWEKTEIIYRGQENATYKTPETENKTMHYIFRKDGSAVIIENSNDFMDYEFEITSTAPGSFHLTLYAIDKGKPIDAVLMFRNGNLILHDGLGVYFIFNFKK
jgi:hypothetical protein